MDITILKKADILRQQNRWEEIITLLVRLPPLFRGD